MSTRLQRFRVVRPPTNTVSAFSLVVVDGEGRPHLPLTIFYHRFRQQRADSTARTYLNCLLPYFSYLSTDTWRTHRGDQWNSRPACIQEAVRDYLVERLQCKVQPKSTYAFVNLTGQSPTTVRLFLAALKQFYNIAIWEKYYEYSHPLLDAASRLLSELERSEQQSVHRQPQISGVEEPTTKFLSENFFRLAEDPWEVSPVDDPDLGKTLLKGCDEAGFCLRDMIVVRMALETGARIREILTLTVGDWRGRGCNQEARTWNKGSRGRRVKTLRFSSTTARMLRQYVNTDRSALDGELRRLEQLSDSDPLFLSQRHKPYDYQAFKVHWYKLCNMLNLDLNIHAMRHWYVTQSMRIMVEEAESSTDIVSGKETLVRYMAWRDPETLKTYENYFKRLGHYKVQDRVHQNLEKEVLSYAKKKRKTASLTKLRTGAKSPKLSTSNHELLNEGNDAQRIDGWSKLLALGGVQ